MSLRNEHKRSKVASDVSSLEAMSGDVINHINVLMNDLVTLQDLVNTKSYFKNNDKTEMQLIVDTAHKDLWDHVVSIIPVAIKDTNRV